MCRGERTIPGFAFFSSTRWRPTTITATRLSRPPSSSYQPLFVLGDQVRDSHSRRGRVQDDDKSTSFASRRRPPVTLRPFPSATRENAQSRPAFVYYSSCVHAHAHTHIGTRLYNLVSLKRARAHMLTCARTCRNFVTFGYYAQWFFSPFLSPPFSRRNVSFSAFPAHVACTLFA